MDVDAAGTLLSPDSFIDAWNFFLKDDGTMTRRPGLGSHHEAFHSTGSALDGLGLDTTEVLGLFQFDRVTDSRRNAPLFLAKVDDYLIGSRYGTRFDLKLARHLGRRSIADFVGCYSVREHRRYVVVCVNDRGWNPSYWNGKLTPSTDPWDVPAWGYFKQIEGCGYQEFGVFHDNRLFLAGGDPFQVVYSSDDDFRDFANGEAFVLTPEFGKVTGFFRTFFGELIIGQERALTRVVQVSPGVYDGQILVYGLGLANNRSSDMMGNDQVFISTDGQIYTLRTVQEFGDVKTAAMSMPVYETAKEGAELGRPYSWVHKDRENQIMWFGLATGNTVDRCIGYDYKRNKWMPRMANKSIVGPSCAASWRLPRWSGREKVVFGTYQTNNFAATQKGRIFTFTHRHKEDHFLSSRSEAYATAPGDFLPKLRWPNATQGGGAAGWPHQDKVTVAGSWPAMATAQETIQIRCTAIGGSAIIGAVGATVTATIIGGGTLNLGAAYTLGTPLAIGATGITIAFAGPQTIPLVVGREIWIFVDRGRKVTEVFGAALYDNIELRAGMKKVAEDGSRPYKNFVCRASTPVLSTGAPPRQVMLTGVTVITRVVGGRADDQIANEADANYELAQSPFRNSLDVLVKCDEDREWMQIGLLDGNTAKQHHIDQSKSEVAGDFVLRPNLQFVVGATQADAHPLVDPAMVNVETIRFKRKCKTWRFMVGQFTSAANHWGAAASFRSFIGDTAVVGLIPHLEPIEDDGDTTMGVGSSSKMWGAI